jgi:hypothetical protein
MIVDFIMLARTKKTTSKSSEKRLQESSFVLKQLESQFPFLNHKEERKPNG